MSEIPVVMPEPKNSGIERGAEALDKIAADVDRQIVDAPGDLPGVVSKAERCIINMDGEPRAYQRGGMVVRIVRRGPTSARKMRVSRADGALAILPFNVPSMIELMTEAAQWVKPSRSKRTDGDKAVRTINASPLAANALLSRGTWGFAHLTALVMGPTLRPDCSVLSRPGYDAQTGLFLNDCGVAFDPVIENPDRETALAALAAVREILEEFPFESEVDEAVAVSMLLTGLVRASLSGAPLFGTSATVMGSGKTLLGQCVSLLASGLPAAVVTPPKDAKDEQKVFFTIFMEGGDLVVLIDNYERQLASDFLCAVLTAESVKDRVLGASKTATASTAATIIVSGNNLQVAGDLVSRTLICHLDPKTDHPEHRRCSRDLMNWIPENRGRLVPAALTFLRGYLASGERPEIEPWQRFPEWDALVRNAIVWANLPDPLLALRKGEASDPRRIEHQAVMEAWREEFGECASTVREAIKAASSRALIGDYRLQDALLDIAAERGEINMRKLGRWLGKMRGRLQGGLRIERGNLHCGIQTWRVIK